MMKRLLSLILLLYACACAHAQVKIVSGTCGNNIEWSFDQRTLKLKTQKYKPDFTLMPDYDINLPAPWYKYKDMVKTVKIGEGISNIGNCAFMDFSQLTDVEFEGVDVGKIGWGAFMNCSRLSNITLPMNLTSIGTIAFARCSSLITIAIPDKCRVEAQAFVSCDKLADIDVSPTAILCDHVFAREVVIDGKTRHALYSGLVRRLPDYVNANTCHKYGIAAFALPDKGVAATGIDYDLKTSDIDEIQYRTSYQRNDIVALVIGNQNYRFAPYVPYAIHDARVFADYCEKKIGVPRPNIHVAVDATKQMILEEEMEWLSSFEEKGNKHLIIYYAGHGVPVTFEKENGEKVQMSYILPVDVFNSHGQKGIALDSFYSQIGEMGFAQTTVFLDACFSGVDRLDEGVVNGLRGVGERAADTKISKGNIVAFAAAQDTEAAQGYDSEGHGLFTYCLLSAIAKTPNCPFGRLFDAIKSDVVTRAPQLRLRKSQTPVITSSSNVGDSWRDFTF